MTTLPFLSKIGFAFLLSPLQPRQTPSGLLKGRSSFERTMSMVNLVDRLIPGTASRISRGMVVNTPFPWAPVDVELIAFGTGAAVFRVDWEGEVRVLRIYRKSLGKPLRGIIETARYYRKNYETVFSWYGDGRGLMLPMEFLVLQGPSIIGPVAASLQPYIPGQKLDLFDDFTEDQAVSLLQANHGIREQFLFFAEQTLHQWEGRQMCYDFLGRENLLLSRQGDRYRLHIVDVGIFRFDLPANRVPEKLAQIERRMGRLAALYRLTRGH